MSNYLALLNYNLTRVNASTINYSTLVGSTIIASSIVSNSSINVTNIITQTINYSTLTGSTLTAQTINYSTLTGSSMATNTMTTNALVVNSTLTGSTLTTQNVNYSTLTGSTLTAQTINYSTLRGSTMTINTLVIASTLTVSTLIATNNPAGVITSSMISLGASTNQSYTALAQGNYSTSTNWLSTLNNLSSTKFVAMSGNAQTQLAVTQMNTTTSIYYTSTLAQNWSTISNVTGLPTATQTNYTCGAVSGNGQYGLLGTSNGYLYLTSALTSATGPSFTNVNPIANLTSPIVYLPFETVPANGSTSQGTIPATLTVTGTITSVPGIVGTNAINIANTAGGTPSNYIRGTVANYTNFSVSGWFNLQTLPSGTNSSIIFGMGISGGNYFDIQYTGGTGFVVKYYNTSSAYITIATAPVSANIWYNFTVIFQSGSTSYVYLNNVLIGTATTTALLNPTTTFSLGAATHFPERAFNGYIDDLRIYNSAITFTPVNWSNVAISNSGQYMLATVASGGLYMSSNFGSSWSQVSAALLQAMWSLLEISLTGQYMSVYAPPVMATPQFAGITAGITGTWTVNNIVWTVSASSYYSDNNYPTSVFNNLISGSGWACGGAPYTPSYPSSGTNIIILGVGTIYGDWLQLQSSTPLVMNSYTFASGGNQSQLPRNYYIVGSNDGTNWYPIQHVTGTTNASTAANQAFATYFNVSYTGTQSIVGGQTGSYATIAYPTSGNAYTYFRIITTTIWISGGVQIGEWYINFTAGGQLYSTNFGSSWGNLMPANTSKLALSGSGQYALENINTTTVTTTPKLEGLAAAIEGTWNVSGVVWTASTSSYSAAPDYYPTNVFSTNNDYSWSSGGAPYTPTYPNSGTNTVTIGVGTIYGEYLQLRNSVPLVMNSYTFMSAAFGIVQMPRNYYIVGSNDGTNWYPIQYVVGIVNPATNTKQAFTTYFNISYTGIQIITAGQVGSFYTTAYPTSGNAYTYFRIITTRVWHTTTSNVEIGKWYINFNNIFTQPQLTGLTGVTTGNAVTSWTSNNVTWTSSASSTYSNANGYQPWRVFDNAISGSWASAFTSSYNPAYQGTTYGTIILGGIGTIYGEWLQLQSSVPLVMNSYTFIAANNVQIPKNYYIVGSNDGTNWYPIQYVVGVTNAVNGSGDGKPFITYFNASYTGTQTIIGNQTGSYTTTAYSTSTNSYTYFRIITTSVWSGGPLVEIGEWFINFSNTLTSPQLTGLATASWTLNNIAWNASSSTNYNSEYPAYGAFDNATPGTTWVSATNYTNATPAVATGVTSTTVITSSPTTVNGEWLQLQSSTPLQMYSYTFVITDPGQFPNTYTIAGSNDGTTWYLIQSVTMNQNPNTVNFQSGTYIIANQSGEQTYTTSTRSATFTCTTSAHSRNSYRYFRIIAPIVWGAPARQFGLGEWFVNFTTTTVSPQLSGLTGNTSSSTPVPTTWAANNITWTSNASGLYSSSYQPWYAFNNIAPITSGANQSWVSAENYSASLYNSSNSTTINAPYSAPYLGAWLQIQSSVPVVLYNYTFGSGASGNMAKTYLIAGSNDGTNWYPIQLVSMPSNAFGEWIRATTYLLANYTGTQSFIASNTISVTTTSYSTSSNAYTYFRIICNSTFGGTSFELSEWFLNFTPTQYVTSNYLSPTSSTPYTAPVFSPPLTSTNVPITSAASQTGQYMVLITNNTSGANVYYSTNYGANFTGLTIGTSTMVSCAISLDGSCITVMNATTVYQLNNNSIGFSVAVGNQAGQQNQYQNAIAIGNQAGQQIQGQNSIAIGNYAGQSYQLANSIILNATGSALNSYYSGLYVSPIATYSAVNSQSMTLLGYGTDNQIIQSGVTYGNGVQTIYGEWIQYQLVTPVQISSYMLQQRQPGGSFSGRFPVAWIVVGSVDGINWVVIDTRSGGTSSLWGTTYTLNATSDFYSYFRIIITQINSTLLGEGYYAGYYVDIGGFVLYNNSISIFGAYTNYTLSGALNNILLYNSTPVCTVTVSGSSTPITNGFGIYSDAGPSVGYIITSNGASSPSIPYKSFNMYHPLLSSGEYNASFIAVKGTVTSAYNAQTVIQVSGNMSKVQLIDTTGNRQPSIEFMRGQTTFDGNPTYSNWRIVASGGQSDGLMPSINAGMLGIYHNGGGFAGYSMVLSDGGNVGIGTTNPNAPLHVIGNINLTGSVQYNGVSITTGTGSIWNAATGGVAYYTGGNVGIGTATPNAQLQLGNTVTNRKIVLYEDINNDHQFYGFGINGGVLRYQGASHVFYTGINSTTSNELMRITGSGNVGIGTNNPAAPLHVYGAGTSASFTSYTFSIGSNTQPRSLIFGTDATAGSIQSVVSGNASAYLTLNPLGGNVGIGTNAPDGGTLTTYNSNSAFVTHHIRHYANSNWMMWMQFGAANYTAACNFIIFQDSTGNQRGTITSNGQNTLSYGTTSDRRIKNNINDIDNVRPKIECLRPRRFKLNGIQPRDEEHYGFIAQEVQNYYPYLVSGEESDTNILQIDYSKFSPFAIAGCKDLYIITDTIIAKNKLLETTIQQQANEITALQSTVAVQSTQVLQTQVNAQQIQIAQLMSQINQLTQRLASANIP